MAQKRSLGRRVGFGAVMLVALAGAAELSSLLVYRIQRHEWFSYSKAHAAEEAVARPGAAAARAIADPRRPVVVHPYLGYTFDPESPEAREEAPPGLRADPSGFQTASPPIEPRAPDKVIVALTGGSVAYYLSSFGRDALTAELAKAPSLRGKRIELVTLAMGAYKQPQQLLALTWLLALGAQFDVVINLDGFNEIALPMVENVDASTYPYYPASWHSIVAALDDRAQWATLGRLADAREQRQAAAESQLGSWLRWSITANTWWSLRDGVRQKRIAGLQQLFKEESAARPRTFARNGPKPPEVASRQAAFGDYAQFWKRASSQIARLAQPNGFRYFHFLQANQYDLDSKPLAPDERAEAYRERSPYRRAVELGYPSLRAAGAELTAEGVSFHDLSRLFAGRRERLYQDDCCHYNEAGYRLMAAHIGRVVAAELR